MKGKYLFKFIVIFCTLNIIKEYLFSVLTEVIFGTKNIRDTSKIWTGFFTNWWTKNSNDLLKVDFTSPK